MRIVLVHSFKGGSGKSLFASNLANIWSDQGRSILLIETDFVMPAFQSIYLNLKPDIFLNDFLDNDDNSLTKYIYNVKENFDIIFSSNDFNPSHKIFSRDQQWFREKKDQLNQAIKDQKYDTIIFDTSPGFSLFIINLLLLADMVFILLRSDNQSIKGTQILIDKVYKKSVDLGKKTAINIVVNQIPQVREITPILNEITIIFSTQYSFIKNIYFLQYYHHTSYLTSVNRFLLPGDNSTRKEIEEIIDNIEFDD